MSERVMVIGGDGRGHELARQIAGSDQAEVVFAAPGNSGIALLDKTVNVPIDPLDSRGILAFAEQADVSWVVISPEQPLVAGVADPLRNADLKVFGPSKAAARLEGSKGYSADFMRRYNIPRPESYTAVTLQEALDYIKYRDPETYVLKADGLAAGKGVVLPKTVMESQIVLRKMLSGQSFGGAGTRGVVIQERLHGPEVSAFAVSDGTNFVLLPFAQDHKRLKDNDQGPNTGGMGAITPLPASLVSAAQAAKIHNIMAQTIAGMNAEGTPFQGALYAGLMLAEEYGGDPTVIEFNVRFGDPEAEIILSLLGESGFDVTDMLLQASNGDISNVTLPARLGKTVLTVALAAADYPDTPRKGDVIHGLNRQYENVFVHHAGTVQEDSVIRTAGGRVLYVTGIGVDANEAAAHAYAAIGPDAIHFDGMQYRTDIGHQLRTNR